MATKQENTQKYNWWANELESLGVSVKVRNELNNIQETSNLVENLKRIFYQAYKSAYNDNDDNNKSSTDFQMALA
jgi:flagellin-specific chaperone FliS